MAIAGDFKVGSGKDELNPFGNFSPLYFQTIFNAYVAHRNKIAAALKREEDVLKIQESIEEEEKLCFSINQLKCLTIQKILF